ncbi:FecCD family ABC transporter permease [Gulosibacter hominis]|uniref:FecCD family ABC transporter permease n=1 Tax=Gulosibacter hominis TaxID=2770504 RepID=UPI00191AF95D|nr:iron ABC transporter permease [Gulosibacter hominis]
MANNQLQRRRLTAWALGISLIVLLVTTIVWSIATGQYAMTPDELLATIRRFVGIDPPAPIGSELARNDAVLLQVRLPRIVLGLVVGAALAVAGVLTQSLFGNPLAEPGVIGITSGAALGAAISIVFGFSWLGIATTPFVAFLAGLVTSAIVWSIARSISTQRAISLLLVGIAINALAGAATAFIFVLAPTTARDAVVFWQLGSINGATWTAVLMTALPVAVALIAVLWLPHRLDALALGDRAAKHLGLRVELVRILTIVLAALLTGAAVSFVGVIGFVGLVVPHAVRLLVGPQHRHVLPLSLLGGAWLVSIADLGARTLVAATDLPIGMMTAIIGAPVFLLLLRQTLDVQRRGEA